MEHRRQEQDRTRPLGQERPLVAAQSPGTPDRASLAALHEVVHANLRLYRAFLLKEELRLLYYLTDRSLASAPLDAWLAWASRSKLKPFVKLAQRPT